jgi:hypothetical protein
VDGETQADLDRAAALQLAGEGAGNEQRNTHDPA